MLTVNSSTHESDYVVYIKGAFETVVSKCETILKNGQIEPFITKEAWKILSTTVIVKIDSISKSPVYATASVFGNIQVLVACTRFRQALHNSELSQEKLDI